MQKTIALTGICLGLTLSAVLADQTTVSFDSGSLTVMNVTNTALSGGSSADGNGDVLQLGYFTGANFSGTFVPLSGQGSLNTAVIPGGVAANPGNETYNQTSIGDLNANGAGDGTFGLSLDFIVGNATSGNSLPSAGTLLAVRFYNGTTIAGSTAFNTVTDPLWIWAAPATPPSSVAMTLDDPGLLWQSITAMGMNPSTAFHTSIPTAVPEPATLALIGMSAGLIPLFRRRRRS